MGRLGRVGEAGVRGDLGRGWSWYAGECVGGGEFVGISGILPMWKASREEEVAGTGCRRYIARPSAQWIGSLYIIGHARGWIGGAWEHE